VDSDIASVTADAAYDTIAFYDAVGARGATVVVPPAKTASVSRRRPRSGARDRTITRVKRLGRRRWKKASGYQRQARVENAVFRYKSIIEDCLRARTPGGRQSEARLACNVLHRMTELFEDPDQGGFFTTSNDHEELIARRKDVNDHPIPSGNSAAAYGLLRLAALTGEQSYERSAVGVFRLFHSALGRHPQAVAHMLRALDFHLSPIKEVALISPAGAGAAAVTDAPVSSGTAEDGPERFSQEIGELTGVVRAEFRPRIVVAAGREGSESPELLRERSAVDGQAAAYVCERFTCQAPGTDPDELSAALE